MILEPNQHYLDYFAHKYTERDSDGNFVLEAKDYIQQSEFEKQHPEITHETFYMIPFAQMMKGLYKTVWLKCCYWILEDLMPIDSDGYRRLKAEIESLEKL